MRVGVIGLGLMGLPMSVRLLASGHQVTVWNRSADKAAEAVKAGATMARSPGEVASGAQVVITMLTDAAAVASVAEGPNGILQHARSGLVWVDTSTVGTVTAREWTERARAVGVDRLDAPVAGSVGRARTGQLTLFVGGAPEVLERAATVLTALGTVRHIGPTGAGATMKLMFNNLLAVECAALGEVAAMADALGLSRASVLQALAGTTAFAPLFEYKWELMVRRQYPPAFTVRNMVKDLHLAADMARECAFELKLGAAARQLYEAAMAGGLDAQDMAAVAESFQVGGTEHADRSR